jgi:hypothetical protein
MFEFLLDRIVVPFETISHGIVPYRIIPYGIVPFGLSQVTGRANRGSSINTP